MTKPKLCLQVREYYPDTRISAKSYSFTFTGIELFKAFKKAKKVLLDERGVKQAFSACHKKGKKIGRYW
jgi:hypothetical protein